MLSVFQDGKVTPICVGVGDKVLLPEYGGTKVVLDDKVRYWSLLNYKMIAPLFRLF